MQNQLGKMKVLAKDMCLLNRGSHIHRCYCFSTDKNSAEVDIAPASGKVNRPWNIVQGHRVKVRAWRACQGQILCKVSDSQLSLMSRKPNFDVKIFKVSGPWNIGQGHRVKVRAWRVCQGHLLCKVSDLQLSLMSRKPNFDIKIFKVSGP